MLLYLSPGCEPTLFAKGIEEKRFSSGMQVQRFNSLVIRGLSYCDEVSAIGHLPYANSQSNELDSSVIRDDAIKWYCLKNYHGRYGKIKRFKELLFKGLTISKQQKVKAVFADAISPLYALAALIIAKRSRCTSVGIVTDVPMYMCAQNKSLRARLTQSFLTKFDYYVLLSKPMDAVVNPNHHPSIVMEGLCEYDETPLIQKAAHDKFRIVYAGSVDDGNGITNLLNAFNSISGNNAELVIYGSGPLVGRVTEYANKNSNISYGGVLDSEQMRESLRDADVLINPRPVDLDFVAYSFPSKMMDYMSSGTITMCTRLSCISEEYFEHLYVIENDTVEGLRESLKGVINLPFEKRVEIGMGAREFVMKNKNHVAQGKRIYEMITKQ